MNGTRTSDYHIQQRGEIDNKANQAKDQVVIQQLNSSSLVVKQTNENILQILFGLCFVSLFMNLFSIGTNLSLIGILVIGVKLIKIRWQKLHKKGIINLVSSKLRTILLHRSIYDMLADLWYFPRLSLILKGMFGPLIVHQEPEETIHNFDFDPNIKRVFLTQGLIHLLPEQLKLALLPADINNPEFLQLSNSENQSQSEETQVTKQVEDIYKQSELKSLSQSVSDDDEQVQTRASDISFGDLQDSNLGQRQEINLFSSKHSSTSNLEKIIEDKKEQDVSVEEEEEKKSKNYINLPTKHEAMNKSILIRPHLIELQSSSEEKPQMDDIEQIKLTFGNSGIGFQTQLITSSYVPQSLNQKRQLLRAIQPAQLVERYDQTEKFQKFKQLKMNAVYIDSPLQFFRKISSGKYVTHEDKKGIKKALVISGFLFLLQLYFSQSSRRWFQQHMQLTSYLFTFLLTSGSFILFLKDRKNSNQVKQKDVTNTQNLMSQVQRNIQSQIVESILK